MMEMTGKEAPMNWRKFAISALVGAVAGGGAMVGAMSFLDSGALGATSASVEIAVAVGAMFILIAVLVGAGLPNPRFGAWFLNAEDADELREERPMLAYSVASMLAVGAALVLLALAGAGGIVPASTALVGVLAAALLSCVLAFAQWRRMDELMRDMAADCGNLSYYLVLIVGGGWAMLAHLGFAGAPTPLDWLTMLLGLPLLASFIAVGRRGLLKPR